MFFDGLFFIVLILSIGWMIKLWQACNDIEETKVSLQAAVREMKLMNESFQFIARDLNRMRRSIDSTIKNMPEAETTQDIHE